MEESNGIKGERGELGLTYSRRFVHASVLFFKVLEHECLVKKLIGHLKVIFILFPDQNRSCTTLCFKQERSTSFYTNPR
jgi:hypothetical protein